MRDFVTPEHLAPMKLADPFGGNAAAYQVVAYPANAADGIFKSAAILSLKFIFN
jgi:hypothetical protein